MLETQFSLSWEQHTHNISYGLSKFQQNGDFVDMTLAADGCFVKAHQMMLSLISPYIKAIIDSLKCTHPVIFLNNISYGTLCSIIEYVYKGEVQVTDEQMKDLINAGKLLQIKGLQEMSPQTSSTSSSHQAISINSSKSSEPNNTSQTKLRTAVESEEQIDIENKDQAVNDDDQIFFIEDDQNQDELEINDDQVDHSATTKSDTEDNNSCILNQDNDFPSPLFTVTNQGSLQLIFNRYLYFLKYKSTRASGHSQWKCVNYTNTKCPAFIITKNDKVIQQYVKHIHSYHDDKIAKKVESGSMFSSMKNAEEFGMTKKFKKL